MKRLRKERGWSQEALAAEAGRDRTYISGIERVAIALKCTLGALLD